MTAWYEGEPLKRTGSDVVKERKKREREREREREKVRIQY